jgi:hypothetical protein
MTEVAFIQVVARGPLDIPIGVPVANFGSSRDVYDAASEPDADRFGSIVYV